MLNCNQSTAHRSTRFCRVDRTLVCMAALTLICTGNKSAESAQPFTKRFELSVPASGLLADPPSRNRTFAFDLPPGFEIVRSVDGHGASIEEINFGGLNELHREIERTKSGVSLRWKLENDESFPVTGRTAHIALGLTAQPVPGATAAVAGQLDARYDKLRQRFFDQFYYAGRVAELIDPTTSTIKFADQTIYLGQALLWLSLEINHRRQTGGDVEATRRVIVELLDGIDQLNLKANQRYAASDDQRLNGLFVRDDITGPDDERLGGRFVNVGSDWQDRGRQNASPSGDQIFGLMFGLHGVVNNAGDAGLSDHAKQIAARLYDYARQSNFILRLPGDEATRRGSDVRWLAPLLHELQKQITGEDRWDSSKIKTPLGKVSLDPIAEVWDSERLPDSIAGLVGRKLTVPLLVSVCGSHLRILPGIVENPVFHRDGAIERWPTAKLTRRTSPMPSGSSLSPF